MVKATSKTKTDQESEHELEVNAKWSGPEFWKDWGGKDKKKGGSGGSGGFVYFVAFLGALVYYVQAADGFGEGVIGILKALVWPATIVYKLLESFYGLA